MDDIWSIITTFIARCRPYFQVEVAFKAGVGTPP